MHYYLPRFWSGDTSPKRSCNAVRRRNAFLRPPLQYAQQSPADAAPLSKCGIPVISVAEWIHARSAGRLRRSLTARQNCAQHRDHHEAKCFDVHPSMQNPSASSTSSAHPEVKRANLPIALDRTGSTEQKEAGCPRYTDIARSGGAGADDASGEVQCITNPPEPAQSDLQSGPALGDSRSAQSSTWTRSRHLLIGEDSRSTHACRG